MNSFAIILRTFLLFTLASILLVVAQVQQHPTESLDNICGRDAVDDAIKLKREILQRTQYPWITAIYKKDSPAPKFICTGTLIAARTVLTPAHCVRLLEGEALVSVGRHNLQDFAEEGFKTSNVASILIHPEYERKPDADIALLHLSEAIPFDNTSQIRPICLPLSDSDKLADDDDDEFATVAGWERYSSFNETQTKRYSSSAKLVSTNKCIQAQALLGIDSERVFCADMLDGYCEPLSGNVLMHQKNGRWWLRGFAVAGKLNSCEEVFFADVKSYLPWIKENLL